jgi:hypothetical protein
MRRTLAVIIPPITLLCAASASGAGKFPTHDQLNDPVRGTWADDTADVLKPRQLLYEAKDDGKYRVGYNLIREADGDVKGYFIRLTIRNLSDTPARASDDVTLTDAENTVISATDRDTFLALAATLADTRVATSALKPAPRSSSGEEDYTEAYLRGRSEGRILKSAEDAVTGRKMTVWADSFWLGPVLEIPPHGQVSGVRVFLAEPYHPLPLTIRVRVGDSRFDFTTRAK